MIHLPLNLELMRWRAAGRQARLWWRDDDAAGCSPALDRLLRVSDAADVPLTLAVIPSGDVAALAKRLARAPRVQVAQHGVDHLNNREGSAAGEFPHDWPRWRVAGELSRGWERLAEVPHLQKVFVPPWNDVHPDLAAALREAGYVGWSASGETAPSSSPPRFDVHLDLLRWRRGARFRGAARFLGALTTELRRRRRAGQWEAPIGLLTHHLAHDDRAWRFLEAFFLPWTARNPVFVWTSLTELVRGEPTDVRARSHPRETGPRLSLMTRN